MLTLTIQDQPDGIALPDLTARLTRATFSTNLHGDEALSVSAPLSIAASFQRYDRAGLPHAIITDGAATPFQGRVEDTAIQGNGFTMTALGYSRAMTDTRYTALWSDTSVTQWRPALQSEIADAFPDRFTVDTNNRVYITAQKGAIFGNTGLFKVGLMVYQIPDGSSRLITGLSFDYTANAPVNWIARALTFGAGFTAPTVLVSITPGGGPVAGSQNLTFAGVPIVAFSLFFNAADAVLANETGTVFLSVTNVRVVTSTANRVNTTLTANRAAGVNVTATVGSTARMYVGQLLTIGPAFAESVTVLSIGSPTQFNATFINAHFIGESVQAHVIYADEIAKDLAATVAALNPTQLQADTAQIASPGRDLLDESYADQLPSAILDRLITLGDNQTPQGVWEWGVSGTRQLYYRIAGSVGRTWYVDVTGLDVQRSLEQLANSAYAIYHEAGGRALRGAVATDGDSVGRTGVTRRIAVATNTTSLTQANAQRDAALEDASNPPPRFGITFTAIYNGVGGRVPLWLPRAGDTIVIRNLPPTVSPGLDQIRSFRIARTTCDLIARTLTVEPLSALPSLAALLARATGPRRVENNADAFLHGQLGAPSWNQ
jgi:hypothetical protein